MNEVDKTPHVLALIFGTTFALIGVKLLFFQDLSWWWVFSPVLILVGLAVYIMIFVFLAFLVMVFPLRHKDLKK